MAKKRNLADFLWPIAGSLFGLIVVPVAIAQYSQFFNENEWLLPASVAVVVICWCVPLLLHSRARAIYASISARGPLAKVILAALSLAAIAALYFGAAWLLAMHRNHLHTLVRVPEVKLIFKASPLFTVERKIRITREVDAFRSYLVGIGFDPPKEFPPLGVLPGKRGLGMEFQEPGNIYNEMVGIGELNIDDPEYIRRLYAGYMFHKMFVAESADIDKRRNFHEAAAQIYERYYLSSFTNKAPLDNSGKWEEAFWDIRQKHGKDFLDKALFYAFKQWDVPTDNVENEEFDAFFGIRFRNGVHVADNYMQNQGSVSSILKAHGIGSSSTTQPTP